MNEPRRMFPLGGDGSPSRAELWDTGARYEVRRNGSKIWQSPFHSHPCYSLAYDRYIDEVSR